MDLLLFLAAGCYNKTLNSGANTKEWAFPLFSFIMVNIEEKITEFAESLTGQHGVVLFDVEVAGSIRRPLVRIYIDREGGVTLDECERFSRSLSALLDVEDPIPSSYVIEVSSPGLDRKLKKPKHYEQSIGRLARLVLKNCPEKQDNVLTGRIKGVQGDSVMIGLEDDEEVLVPFDTISKARLEIEIK